VDCLPLCSEEDVVRGLRDGDPDALARLMAAYRQRLVRYAAGILAGDGCAEDVVQETFLRLWTRRQDLKLAGSLRALLYTLTRNAAIDERRRGARRTAKAAIIGDPAPPPSPLDQAAASEMAVAVSAAIARLPARRREVFLLVRVRGLSYHEVATWLNVAPQTVANQMTAAMATLRDALARFGVTDSGRSHKRRPARVLPFHQSGTDRAHTQQQASA